MRHMQAVSRSCRQGRVVDIFVSLSNIVFPAHLAMHCKRSAVSEHCLLQSSVPCDVLCNDDVMICTVTDVAP